MNDILKNGKILELVSSHQSIIPRHITASKKYVTYFNSNEYLRQDFEVLAERLVSLYRFKCKYKI